MARQQRLPQARSGSDSWHDAAADAQAPSAAVAANLRPRRWSAFGSGDAPSRPGEHGGWVVRWARGVARWSALDRWRRTLRGFATGVAAAANRTPGPS